MERNLRWLACLALTLLLVPLGSHVEASEDAREFMSEHEHLAGLYRAEDENVIIGLLAGAQLMYFERMTTGDMRFLRKASDGRAYEYSPTRNLTDEVEGQIEFHLDEFGAPDRLTWKTSQGSEQLAHLVTQRREEVTFQNGAEATLKGTLFLPAGEGPFPAALVITQGHRTDLWDVGMWLRASGLAVLLYDQRNHETGTSVGTEVTGRYQEKQQVYSGDAVAGVRFLQSRKEIDPGRVGVIGWSGGGFIGAFVAAEVPELRFLVNIAGDASPGLEQISHMFVARLLREGYSDLDVESARHFMGLHSGVSEGRVSWDDYRAEIERVADKEWYQFLTGRYSIPFQTEEAALSVGSFQSQWPPDRVYGKISSAPTLGLFFEFDQSSSPNSPIHFHSALRAAGNPDYSIVMIPDAHHGGFELQGMGYRFDTSRFERRTPVLIDVVTSWVSRQTLSSSSGGAP